MSVFRGDLEAGEHEIVWSGVGEEDLAAGVYFVRLATDEGAAVRRVVHVR